MASASGASQNKAQLEDLTNLLRSYMNEKGDIDPDKAPSDMKVR